MNCIVDGHHGVYVPQVFAERNRSWREANEPHWVFDLVDEEILLSGLGKTEEDFGTYWESWNCVLDNATHSHDKSLSLYLGESGDLFEAMESDFDEDGEIKY